MPAPMQKNTWHPVYSSPPRQARPEPREPPPAPRKPPKQSTRRWADYEDDEPLPQFVFGTKMWEDDGWTNVKRTRAPTKYTTWNASGVDPRRW